MLKSFKRIDFISFYFNFPYFSINADFFSEISPILLIMATMVSLKTAKIVKNIHFCITKIIMI